MRVLLTAAAGSHLLPQLPFCAALRARGDELCHVVAADVAPHAAKAGGEVVVGAAAEPAALADAWARFQTAPPAEAAVIANREIFGRLQTRALLPAVTAACERWRPDLVLHDPAEYAAPIAALRAEIPSAQVAISLSSVERGSLELARPELEQLEPGATDRLLATPYLTRFPAALDPDAYVRTVRYREGPAPQPVRAGPPLVYVTFGTVAGGIGAGAPYAAVLAALAGLDIQVLVTTGTPLDLGPQPPHVRVEAWVDQAEVLPRASLVVCHGGSGTVLGALRHGVPLVVLPLFADQPTNAHRAAEVGAAVVVDRGPGAARDRVELGAADIAALRSATVRVLAEPSYSVAAARIAAAWGGAPSVAQALLQVCG